MKQVNQHQQVFFQSEPNQLVYPLIPDLDFSQLHNQQFSQDCSFENSQEEVFFLPDSLIQNASQQQIDTNLESKTSSSLQDQNQFFSEIQISQITLNDYLKIDFLDAPIKQLFQTSQTSQQVQIQPIKQDTFLDQSQSPLYLPPSQTNQKEIQNQAYYPYLKNQNQQESEISNFEEKFQLKTKDFDVNQEIDKQIFSSDSPNHKNFINHDNPIKSQQFKQQIKVSDASPTQLILQQDQLDPTPLEPSSQDKYDKQQSQNTDVILLPYPIPRTAIYQQQSQDPLSPSTIPYQQSLYQNQPTPYHQIQFNDDPIPQQSKINNKSFELSLQLIELVNRPQQSSNQFQEIIINPIDTIPPQFNSRLEDNSIEEIVNDNKTFLQVPIVPLQPPFRIHSEDKIEQIIEDNLPSSQESSILFHPPTRHNKQEQIQQMNDLNHQIHSFQHDWQEPGLESLLLNLINPSCSNYKPFKQTPNHELPSINLQSKSFYQIFEFYINQIDNLLLPHQMSINQSIIIAFFSYLQDKQDFPWNQTLMLSLYQILSFQLSFSQHQPMKLPPQNGRKRIKIRLILNSIIHKLLFYKNFTLNQSKEYKFIPTIRNLVLY